MTAKPADAAVTSDDVEQGRILWLPPLEEVLSTSSSRGQQAPVVEVARGTNPSPNMYNHPIVVFSRPAREPDVIYFLCVSILESYSTVTISLNRNPRSQVSADDLSKQ